MCSHDNAVRYWSQTLNPKRKHMFASHKCNNWTDYMKGLCSKNEVNYMGIEADPNLRGSFFIQLKTNFLFDNKPSFNWLLKRIEKKAVDIVSLNF